MRRTAPCSLVLLLSMTGMAAARPMQAEKTMSSDQHQAATGVEISRGTVGIVGGSRVGVVALTATAPPFQGALSGATATLVVASDTAGVHAETTLDVQQRMLLPLADGLHRLDRLALAGGDSERGHVEIAVQATGGASAGSWFLGEGGKLRIGGPDAIDATDLRILKLEPDEHTPQSATVEWLPAEYAREDTPANRIRQQALKVGDRIQVGKLHLTVKSIQGRTVDHPCWVEFVAS